MSSEYDYFQIIDLLTFFLVKTHDDRLIATHREILDFNGVITIDIQPTKHLIYLTVRSRKSEYELSVSTHSEEALIFREGDLDLKIFDYSDGSLYDPPDYNRKEFLRTQLRGPYEFRQAIKQYSNPHKRQIDYENVRDALWSGYYKLSSFHFRHLNFLQEFRDCLRSYLDIEKDLDHVRMYIRQGHLFKYEEVVPQVMSMRCSCEGESFLCDACKSNNPSRRKI